MNNEARQIIYKFSIMCGKFFIDEHVALENPRIRQRLAIKEPVDQKMQHLQNILESEF